MSTNANTAASHASASGGNAQPLDDGYEIIPLDDTVDGSPTTDRDQWIEFVAVRHDERERDLTGHFYDLERDIAISFDAAGKTDSPKVIATSLRNVVAALKSMVILIRALDKHRHGIVQKIIVEYGDGASAPAKTVIKDTRLAEADRRIDELFLAKVHNLACFEANCRKEAKILGTTPGRELLRMECGRRVGPDRRTWETKFLGLASNLAGQVVKFTQAIETRHTRGRQHILVTYVGDVPPGKIRKKTAMPASYLPLDAGAPAKLVSIAQFVKKTNKNDDHAAA